jgi:hypothetical protein
MEYPDDYSYGDLVADANMLANDLSRQKLSSPAWKQTMHDYTLVLGRIAAHRANMKQVGTHGGE